MKSTTAVFNLLINVVAMLVLVSRGGGSGGSGGNDSLSTNTAPTVSLSPSSLTFAAQAVGTTSVPQSVTLTNKGNATLTVSAISTNTDFPQTNPCITTLSPGADCNISVTFSPQATGTMTSNLSVYDNGSGSPQSIPLSGTGTNPVPTITSLSPPSATAGALPQTLTINGSDFVASSTVTYNAIPHMATVVNSTQLTISLTAGDQATASDYPVVVTNPAPGGGSSNAVNFTVNTPPQPVISSVSLIMAQNKPSRYRGGGLATMDPRLLISATVLWTQCSATRARLPS